jgi:hypothetical protein
MHYLDNITKEIVLFELYSDEQALSSARGCNDNPGQGQGLDTQIPEEHSNEKCFLLGE